MPQASSGKAGIGVVLQVSDGASPPVWATVSNNTELNVGGASTNVIDTTHLDSPNFYSEKLPGLKTSADWTGTIQFDPTDPTLDSATGLRKFFEDRSLETFRVNYDAVFTTFGLEADAYVTELANQSITPEGLITQAFTLSIVGKVREVTIS